MTRVKQWLLDVGLWEAESLTDWSWKAFRWRFWTTPTNYRNRTAAKAIKSILSIYSRDVRRAYERGFEEGAVQVAEVINLSSQTENLEKERFIH